MLVPITLFTSNPRQFWQFYCKEGEHALLSSQSQNTREDIRDYVAHLQLHMTLQARNLVPTLTQAADSREELLQQTQANFEKFVSRQRQ
jgi:hypothetical protein